jgi:hypothetical protein
MAGSSMNSPSDIPAMNCMIHQGLTFLYNGISPKQSPMNGAPPSQQKWHVLFKVGLLLLLVWLAMPRVAFGQLDPRTAIPAPPGTASIFTYYRHISGNDLYRNEIKVSENFNFSADIGIIRPVYWNQVFGYDYILNLIVPFGERSLRIPNVLDQTTSGLGDIQLVAGLWPYANREKGLYLVPGVYVTVPSGNYDNEKSVNMGANRWAFKPELDFTWKSGKWCVELQSNIEFYTDNDEFGANKLTLERDPVITAGSHVTYDITKSFWAGASLGWVWGGGTRVNGINANDELSTGVWMLTMNYRITKHWGILMNYASDFAVKNGPALNQIRFRLGYSW